MIPPDAPWRSMIPRCTSAQRWVKFTRNSRYRTGRSKQIVGEIGRARGQLKTLSGSVAEIDTIVGTVHAITDQTKILAINATIEAVKPVNSDVGLRWWPMRSRSCPRIRPWPPGMCWKNRSDQCHLSIFHRFLRRHRPGCRCPAPGDRYHRPGNQSTASSSQCHCRTDGRHQGEYPGSLHSHCRGQCGNRRVLEHSMTTNHCAEEIACQLGELLSGSVRGLDALTGKQAAITEEQHDQADQPDMGQASPTAQYARKNFSSLLPTGLGPENSTLSLSPKAVRTT